MISIDQVFNDDTVNVFTDASVKRHEDIFESVAGVEIHNLTINDIDMSRYVRLFPSTNNEAEIHAIYMGVLACIEIRNKHPDRNFIFNIFSDSKISVLGIRDWYSGWVRDTINNNSPVLINSSGEPVKNQQIFINIFDAILKSGICINLYHMRGHINMFNPKQIDTFTRSFKSANNLNDYPSRELVDKLIIMNNLVDNTSRSLLAPNGPNIPTITGTHRPEIDTVENIKIKSEYLFTVDKDSITTERKRYAELIKTNRF